MIPYLLAALGGYLIGDSIGEDIEKKIPEFAEGGIMADGGEVRKFYKKGKWKYILINVKRKNNFQKWSNKKETLEKEIESFKKYNPELASEFQIFETEVNEKIREGLNSKGDTVVKRYDESFSVFELKPDSTMARGGMVVTSIKDIPNFKQRLDEGKITYRGLGLGKLYDDFYDLAGETGTRIKVDGKEYFITDTEFDTFSRGKDGLMRIRFDAPYRKGAEGGIMANGGVAGGKEMWMIIDLETKNVIVSQLFLYEYQAEDKIKSLIKNKSLSKNDKLEIIKLSVKKDDYIEYKKIRSELFKIKGKDNFWRKRSGAVSRVSDLENKERGLLEKIKDSNKFAEGGIMAKGGKIKVGDKVRSVIPKYNFEGEVLSTKGDMIFVRMYNALPNGDMQHQTFRINEVERMANGGGITVIESSPRSEYEDYEMLVISKDAEKDGGGFHKHRYLVSAKNIQEAKEIATRMFEEDSRLSDYYFYEVMSEERYRMFYMDKFVKGGVVGDAARVKSKNKTGVIMKVFKADDFEQFSDIKPEKHYLIKFVDGTQDTYAKSELEFYKFSD